MTRLIWVLMISAPSLCHAVLCNSYAEKPNDPYYFVDSMFSAVKDFDNETEKIRKSTTENTVFTITTSIPKLKCLIEELKPFKESSDKLISVSAKGISDGANQLIASYQNQIALLKAVEEGSIQGKTNISQKIGELVNDRQFLVYNVLGDNR